MRCSECKTAYSEFSRYCTVCERDIGFPNVRAALKDDEISALEFRKKEALISVKARNCENNLIQFEQSVTASKVIFSTSLENVLKLVGSPNSSHVSFYSQINSGTRVPEKNDWDNLRIVVDSTLFPYYKEKMIFGMLSLDDRGLSHYGDFTIVLKDLPIKMRTSFFNDNSCLFAKQHKLMVGAPVPKGYRSDWERRHILASAKLHHKVLPTSTPGDHPGFLVSAGKDGDDDFIEAHIYGNIHREAIEKVVGKKPKDKAQKAMIVIMEKFLKSINANLELK